MVPFLKAFYTQNLQISISVSIVVGLLALVVRIGGMWWFACLSHLLILKGAAVVRCCRDRRRPTATMVDPALKNTKHVRLISEEKPPSAMAIAASIPRQIPVALLPEYGRFLSFCLAIIVLADPSNSKCTCLVHLLLSFHSKRAHQPYISNCSSEIKLAFGLGG